jgi:hypothetical protein
VISSLVIGTAPAWSGTFDSRSVLATAQVISSNSSAPSRGAERSWLEPSGANARPKASDNCRPGHVVLAARCGWRSGVVHNAGSAKHGSREPIERGVPDSTD